MQERKDDVLLQEKYHSLLEIESEHSSLIDKVIILVYTISNILIHTYTYILCRKLGNFEFGP